MAKKTGVYFPGLNALRFFAAFAVIITHIELIKKYLGFSTLWKDIWNPAHGIKSIPLDAISAGKLSWLNPPIAEAGPLGVVFFFVLSGFLITYLLFAEKEKTGEIKIKHFYLRRIFRIWPLYYLVLILGFFVLPHIPFFEIPAQNAALEDHFLGNLLGYIIILPNLSLSLFEISVPNIGQLWSIGVEEQFYLIWPLLIFLFKKPLKMMLVLTAFLIFLKVSLVLATDPMSFIALKKFLAMSKIECMTIGGIGAYFLFKDNKKFLNLIYQKVVFVLCILAVPSLLYVCPRIIQDGIHLVYALCFLIIIMNVSGKKRGNGFLETPLLNFLGKISYGLYMYHLMIVAAAVHFFRWMFPNSEQLTTLQNIVLYLTVIGITILVSHLSYRYFELPFIKMKKKFTKVVSGEEAR